MQFLTGSVLVGPFWHILLLRPLFSWPAPLPLHTSSSPSGHHRTSFLPTVKFLNMPALFISRSFSYEPIYSLTPAFFHSASHDLWWHAFGHLELHFSELWSKGNAGGNIIDVFLYVLRKSWVVWFLKNLFFECVRSYVCVCMWGFMLIMYVCVMVRLLWIYLSRNTEYGERSECTLNDSSCLFFFFYLICQMLSSSLSSLSVWLTLKSCTVFFWIGASYYKTVVPLETVNF